MRCTIFIFGVCVEKMRDRKPIQLVGEVKALRRALLNPRKVVLSEFDEGLYHRPSVRLPVQEQLGSAGVNTLCLHPYV